MERYVARRRRELFTLDGELHRTVLDAAIGGTPLRTLVDRSFALHRKPIAVDLDGELTWGGGEEADVPAASLDRVHNAAREVAAGEAQAVWIPPLLARPVVTGAMIRGLVLMVGTDAATIDEDELLLSVLASAVAIALARMPADVPPDLETYLQRDSGDVRPRWALALAASSGGPAGVARVLSSELAARGLDRAVAVEGDLAVALIPGPLEAARAIFDAVTVRLRSEEIRGGRGRPGDGPDGLRRSVREAREALKLGAQPFTLYESIEVDALLSVLPHAGEYTRSRLGPLLDRPELLLTLSAFLDCGRRVADTAERLHVHRNTVIYRVNRIRDLLEVDLDDGEIAFALQLALRLEALSSRPSNESGRTG
jgi:hypothetical protein